MEEPTSNLEIARRLRLVRERLELGQQNVLAKQLGASPKRYNNWETGTAIIPIDIAAKLCTLAPIDLDYLYRGELSALPMKIITLLEESRASSPKSSRGKSS